MADIHLQDVGKFIPDAFHGTSETAALAIEKVGTFKKGYGETLMLGPGVYFYEGSRAWAIKWARMKHHRRPIAVLQCTLALGFCLDLTDPDHQDAVRTLVAAYNTKCGVKVTDAQAINMVANKTKVDSIKAVLPTQNPAKMFGSSRFLKEIQIIFCMRTLANISNIRIVYRGR